MRPCNPHYLFGQAKHQAASNPPNPGSLSAHPATCFWSKQPFFGFSLLFPLLALTHVGQERTGFSWMCRAIPNTIYFHKINKISAFLHVFGITKHFPLKLISNLIIPRQFRYQFHKGNDGLSGLREQILKTSENVFVFSERLGRGNFGRTLRNRRF
jgi:hypothetical protein